MSPVDNTPPGIRKQPAHTDYRLRELERTRVAAQGVTATIGGEEFPGYSVPGIVADGTVMPLWYAKARDHPYITARVSALGVPSVDSEFHLAIDGSTVQVLTLPAAAQTALVAVSFTLLQSHYFGGTLVTGGGASNWSMQLEETAV